MRVELAGLEIHMEVAQTEPVQVVRLIEAVVVQEIRAALVLSSLKYLTTYPQHSLVALHLACPHLVGSTSTL
jgi:hypothetical protein